MHVSTSPNASWLRVEPGRWTSEPVEAGEPPRVGALDLVVLANATGGPAHVLLHVEAQRPANATEGGWATEAWKDLPIPVTVPPQGDRTDNSQGSPRTSPAAGALLGMGCAAALLVLRRPRD